MDLFFFWCLFGIASQLERKKDIFIIYPHAKVFSADVSLKSSNKVQKKILCHTVWYIHYISFNFL